LHYIYIYIYIYARDEYVKQTLLAAEHTVPLEKLDQGPGGHVVNSNHSILAKVCLPAMTVDAQKYFTLSTYDGI